MNELACDAWWRRLALPRQTSRRRDSLCAGLALAERSRPSGRARQAGEGFAG